MIKLLSKSKLPENSQAKTNMPPKMGAQNHMKISWRNGYGALVKSLSLCIGSKTLMSWGLAYLPVGSPGDFSSARSGSKRWGSKAKIPPMRWSPRPGSVGVRWDGKWCPVYKSWVLLSLYMFMPPKWNKKVIEVGQCWVLTLSFVCALRALDPPWSHETHPIGIE